jgi:hypothetical protein
MYQLENGKKHVNRVMAYYINLNYNLEILALCTLICQLMIIKNYHA